MRAIVRIAGLVASVAASAWQFASGGLAGGTVFAVVALVTLVSILPGGAKISRVWDDWFRTPKGAATAKVAGIGTLALFLGVAQLTGYGLHRDIGRGVLALFAAVIFIAITVDVSVFADRRHAQRRTDLVAQDEWLKRIASPEQSRPKSP